MFSKLIRKTFTYRISSYENIIKNPNFTKKTLIMKVLKMKKGPKMMKIPVLKIAKILMKDLI